LCISQADFAAYPENRKSSEEIFMNLSGRVNEGNGNWLVTAKTREAEGGFICQINVAARNLHGELHPRV